MIKKQQQGKFQFHKGTIKTILLDVNASAQQLFQFHKGTIKTWLRNDNNPDFSVFQFHKGTIKTFLQTKCFALLDISIP